ncbi:MAG: hypothetical protein R2880_08815 [Deinococcales bacterium]
MILSNQQQEKPQSKHQGETRQEKANKAKKAQVTVQTEVQTSLFDEQALSEDLRGLLKHIRQHGQPRLDDLIALTGQEAAVLLAGVSMLELQGAIKRLADERF